MKSASSDLATHLGQEVTTLATLWRVVRKDGTVYTFTDHDQNISIAVGGSPSPGLETYVASVGYARSNLRNTDQLRTETVDLEGILDSSEITERDLRAGLFDNASLDIFLVNYAAPEQGTIRLKRGRLGEVEIREEGYRVTFHDLAEALETTVGEVYAADCIVDLGSTACGVQFITADPPLWQASTAYTARSSRDASIGSIVRGTGIDDLWFECTLTGTSESVEPTWNETPPAPGQRVGGTTTEVGSPSGITWQAILPYRRTGNVTSVTDTRNFADSSRAEPDDWWRFGLITWDTGLNAGLKMEIDQFGSVVGSPSSGEFELKLDMPFEIRVGDAYTVQVGCDKMLSTCRDKFDNVENFRGYGVHLPGQEAMLRTPDAK